METKTCKKCILLKPFSEFSKLKNGKFGLRAVCNECHRKLNKQYYQENKKKVLDRNIDWQKKPENKEAIRFYYVKRMYGIDKQSWLKILKSQNNACAICEITSDKLNFFSTDHDHNTGKIRGLLCKNCNTVLGHAKDNIVILEKAIKYLTGNQN